MAWWDYALRNDPGHECGGWFQTGAKRWEGDDTLIAWQCGASTCGRVEWRKLVDTHIEILKDSETTAMTACWQDEVPLDLIAEERYATCRECHRQMALVDRDLSLPYKTY